MKKTKGFTQPGLKPSGPWAGKTLVLGVTGSIAAYKAVSLVRRMRGEGATVEVAMTHTAQQFVGSLTFQALTGRPVACDGVANDKGFGAMAHLTLAEGADIIVVAPASAHCLAKLAHGLADDLLTSMILAAECPLLVVPAMDGGMWDHPAVRQNVRTLRSRGVTVMEPDTGPLASGRIGKGRFPEEAAIIAAITAVFTAQKDFRGRRVLITAGPTQESLDPIRYLSNHSSGKMGWALAEAARDRGAEVTLIAGPTQLAPPHQVAFIPITTSEDMRKAVMGHFPESDVLIMAAAVADFRPVQTSSEKIAKIKGPLTLALEPTPDILMELPERRPGQVVVGFAAETKGLVESARRKLIEKRLDLIVGNNVGEPGAGFGTDTNRVTLIAQAGPAQHLPLMLKRRVAHCVLDAVYRLPKFSVSLRAVSSKGASGRRRDLHNPAR